MANIEGNGFSQLVQLMRKNGYNKDIEVEIATVKKPLPDFLIKLDKSGLELDKTDCFIANSLTEHSRTVVIDGEEKTMTVHSNIKVGDKVMVVNDEDTFFIIDKAVRF